MDEAVRRWKQTGQVYFWRESDRRQGKGWHLAADAAGCDDLEEVARLSRAATYPARFTFRAAPGQPDARELIISFDQSRTPDHWRLKGTGPMTLELGPDRLEELTNVVADLRALGGDYTFGPDSVDQHIWVWWPPRSPAS